MPNECMTTTVSASTRDCRTMEELNQALDHKIAEAVAEIEASGRAVASLSTTWVQSGIGGWEGYTTTIGHIPS